MHNRFMPAGGADAGIHTGGNADECAINASYATGTACY